MLVGSKSLLDARLQECPRASEVFGGIGSGSPAPSLLAPLSWGRLGDKPPKLPGCCVGADQKHATKRWSCEDCPYMAGSVYYGSDDKMDPCVNRPTPKL